jgi:hypothetical protein
VTWGLAHGRAMIRAAQAHRDLGLDQGAYIDVYQALARADLILYGEKMDGLFGVYIPAVSGPKGRKAGVCLNTYRSPIDQRHSAAHELGHHVFGHGECASDITQVFEDPDPEAWPVREKEAEAFAAWFLMPRVATRKVIAGLGIERLTSPDEVYQVALRLGTSYRGTLRHLANLKLITQGNAARWSRIPRGTLKNRAGGGLAAPPVGAAWVLGPASDGAVLYVQPGDRLVIASPPAPGAMGMPATVPRGVRRAAPSTGEEGVLPLEHDHHGPAEFDITDEFAAGGPLLLDQPGGPSWSIRLLPAPTLREGLNEPGFNDPG